MSTGWVLQALLVGVLLSLAAAAADRAAGCLRLPRRWIWSAAILGSLLLPGLSLIVPGTLPEIGIVPDRPVRMQAGQAGSWTPRGPMEAAIYAANGSPEPEDTPVPAPLIRWWAAVSLAMLGGMAVTYGRWRALRLGCAVTEIGGTQVHLSDGSGPAVVGLRHPVIVLPAWVLALSPEERHLIIVHEREHLESRDGWLLFVAMLALTAMPWSLPLWWQHRRLRAAVETDCDARVLARGADRTSYGRILIRTASTPRGPFLLPAWGQSTSQLERRIIIMTEKHRRYALLRSIPFAAIALAVIATACDVSGDADPADTPAAAARDSTYEVAALERKPSLSNRGAIQSVMEREYPRDLQDAGIGGTVLTQFVLEADGTVNMSSVEVIDSPHQQLSDATIKTMERFRFRPGQYGGRNVRVSMEMPITWEPAG